MKQKYYKISLAKQVKKFLFSHPDIKIRFDHGVLSLLEDPYKTTLDIKKLSGPSQQLYRWRIGKYRFLYEVKEREILIYFYQAGTRGDIYK